MKKFLFILIVILHCQRIYPQAAEIDSLHQVLSELSPDDTSYVDVANAIAFSFSMTDQKNSFYYINLAIATAKKLNYNRGLIRATTLKGNSFLIVGLTDQALGYYLEALNYNASSYPIEFVRLHNNIGEVYRRKEFYDSSLKYFNQALELAKEIKSVRPAIIYSNLGEVSLMQNNYDEAKRYFSLCLNTSLDLNDQRGQGYGYYGLAECSFYRDDISDAIQWIKKSIETRLISGHKRGLIQSYLRLGDYYEADQSIGLDSAFFYWHKTAELAKENDANDLLSIAYNKLYKGYLETDRIESAVTFLEKYKTLQDSIQSAEFVSSVDRIKTALQSELLLAENELLRQEQIRRKSEEDARLIVVILAFIIILGLGFASYQYRKRQKNQEEMSQESLFTKSLLNISNELNLPELDIRSFVNKLLTQSRDSLDCDRASYWSYDKKSDGIVLADIVEKQGAAKIPEVSFTRDQFPSFFDEFLTKRTLAVSRLSQEEALADIHERYFKPAGIESIINAPVLIDGKFVGFVSYTMTYNNVREWSIQEQRYVGSLVDLLTAAIVKERSNQLEIEKEGLIKKLKTRNQSLREFNSIISHNLREPLTQIIGFSDLLHEMPADADFKEIISKISMASNRIDTIIKELSTILNENDPRPSDFRVLNLDRLVKEVLDLLRNEIRNKTVYIDEDLKVIKITTYKPFLSDVLYHLISNCLKFSVPGRDIYMNIKSYEDEYYYYLEISDNGRGMDLKKFSDKIFLMYQRYHMDVEGRGIGLFIVKNRVTALGGLILVESEERIGTTFTIKFPKEG